jgi:hypothetical protein
MTKERTGKRTGPRFRLVVDKTGLWGARACAAGMVNSAISYRRSAEGVTDPRHRAFYRASMRTMALWARIFAGHIEQDDARIAEAQAESTRRCREYCNAA